MFVVVKLETSLCSILFQVVVADLKSIYQRIYFVVSKYFVRDTPTVIHNTTFFLFQP